MKIKFFNKAIQIKNHLLRIRLMKKIGFDNKHGYSLVKSSKSLDYFEKSKNGEWFIKQAYEYDKFGYMHQKLGEELEKQFMDDNYIMGIHRTGNTPMNDKMIKEIFSHGLLNLGKAEQGGSHSISFDINNTVSIFNKFQYLISQIKSAAGYKGSNGSIILKIPKSAIGSDSNTPIPLYNIVNGRSYIRPEFIYGYIPVDYKGNTGNIIRNPNYKDKHTIDRNNVVYDVSVLNNCLEILFRNYEITFNKYGKKQADTALVNFIMNNDTRYFSGENNRKLLNNRIDVYNCIKKLKYPNGITIKNLSVITDKYYSRLNQQISLGIVTG